MNTGTHIVRMERVLKPGEFTLTEDARHLHSMRKSPVHFRADVHDETGIRANGFAHSPREGNIAFWVCAQSGMAFFPKTHLDELVAIRDVSGEFFGHFADLRRFGMGTGAGGQAFVLLSTQ
jgi:hypothetical protein